MHLIRKITLKILNIIIEYHFILFTTCICIYLVLYPLYLLCLHYFPIITEEGYKSTSFKFLLPILSSGIFQISRSEPSIYELSVTLAGYCLGRWMSSSSALNLLSLWTYIHWGLSTLLHLISLLCWWEESAWTWRNPLLYSQCMYKAATVGLLQCLGSFQVFLLSSMLFVDVSLIFFLEVTCYLSGNQGSFSCSNGKGFGCECFCGLPTSA